MLTTQTNNLRAAPTATVADLQDVLADRARSHHDMVVPAGQLRFNPDIGMLEVQGRGGFSLVACSIFCICGRCRRGKGRWGRP
jgi:hypothetical protein